VETGEGKSVELSRNSFVLGERTSGGARRGKRAGSCVLSGHPK
jgi:hypothetical protein